MTIKRTITWTTVEHICAFVAKHGDNGVWGGRLSAQCQRLLFGGVYLGKGRICLDTNEGRVTHRVKVCFGLDSDVTAWINLKTLVVHNDKWAGVSGLAA